MGMRRLAFASAVCRPNGGLVLFGWLMRSRDVRYVWLFIIGNMLLSRALCGRQAGKQIRCSFGMLGGSGAH